MLPDVIIIDFINTVLQLSLKTVYSRFHEILAMNVSRSKDDPCFQFGIVIQDIT